MELVRYMCLRLCDSAVVSQCQFKASSAPKPTRAPIRVESGARRRGAALRAQLHRRAGREELATLAGVVAACADCAVAIDRPEGSRESMRASVREEMRSLMFDGTGHFRDTAEDLRGSGGGNSDTIALFVSSLPLYPPPTSLTRARCRSRHTHTLSQSVVPTSRTYQPLTHLRS